MPPLVHYVTVGRPSSMGPDCVSRADITGTIRWARRVMSNPHKHQHPEIRDEWVERTLLDPYYYEQAPG